MRSKHLMRRSAPFVLTLVLATAFAPGTAALSTTPLNTNLVKNPGAEANVGGNGYTGNGPSKWNAGGPWKVVKYGSPGFPTKGEANRIGGGKNFFSCGPGSDFGSLEQEVRLLGRNSQIDGELLQFTFSVRIATYDAQQDKGSAQVFILDGDRFKLLEFEIGPVSATNGRFLKRTFTDVIPAGARYVLIYLFGDRVGGAADYCDAYFDKVSFVIKKL